MDELYEFSNQNNSSKNTDEIINKIQNSLDRLQSAINNKQILGNINSKNNIPNQNINIRKKTIDSKNSSRRNNPSLTEENISNILFDNNHSMFNNNKVFNTDKRIIQKKINQNRILNNLNMDNINRTAEYIIPRSTQGRSTQYYKINNNNYNRNRNINNTLMRKKCIKCGNINPPRSKFCFNCGMSLGNINISQYNTYNPKKNSNKNVRKANNNNFSNINYNQDMNIENITDSQTIQSQIQFNSNNNDNNIAKAKNSNKDTISSNNNRIMNNIFADLNDIQNEDLINYKKLNDLYLYGDYLENELKASNDENTKLLEKYKTIKIQVHSLNQKKNKIKQNIDILGKKEKNLTKLNEELKNGFTFAQQKLGNNENNEEKIKILNELELNNKKYIEMQNGYEKEIESLKKQITLLADNDEEENDEDEKMIKNLENDIEKKKKELEEKNDEYTLLIKQNEKLNQEIKYLAEQLDLNLSENEGEENLEEEEEEEKEKEDNNINNNNKILELENNSKNKEKIAHNDLNKSENEEKKGQKESVKNINTNTNIKGNIEEKIEIKENNTEKK